MPPEYVSIILKTLNGAGYSAYAVGGCVRDTLLGREPNDWDVASSAPADEVMRLFPKTVPTGIKYGTVTVIIGDNCCEVTTFRRDGAYESFRRPKSVSFGTAVEGDLSRRDFTVNAMAMDAGGEITDLFGGREDINRRIIRCVGDAEARFSEDALRMLRAVRFSAQLGFELSPEVSDAIKKLAHLSSALSPERVGAEMGKILLSPRPYMLRELISFGLTDEYLDRRVLPDKDMLSRISALPPEKCVRFCAFSALLHSCGAVNDSAVFLKKLRLDGKTVRRASAVSDILHGGFPRTDAEIKTAFYYKGDGDVLCAAFSAYCLGDDSAPERAKRVIASGECRSLSQLAVSGRDAAALGYPEGRETGELLHLLMLHVISHPEDNMCDTLLRIMREGR